MTPFVFCDWLTIYQDHPEGGLPVLNDGRVIRVTTREMPDQVVSSITGELLMALVPTDVEYMTTARMEHVGSFDTGLQIRCDGYRVELSGNVSRWGRPDNLFGLSVIECVMKANEILATFGIQEAFRTCEATEFYARSESTLRTNAQITRVDLTSNYSTGGPSQARRFIAAMAGQAPGRLGKNASPKAYSNGVTWNEGSRRWYEKVYYKPDDMGKHATPEVREFAEMHGIVRHEVSLKSNELRDRGLNDVVAWARTQEGQRMENVIYGKFAEKFHRNTVQRVDFSDIPGQIGRIARDYVNGHDVWNDAAVTKRTRQRYRAALLPYGIDIATRPNVQTLAPRVQVIELQPLAMPSWYSAEAA